VIQLRWRFLYDETDADFQRKKATLSLIDMWWRAFEDKGAAMFEELIANNSPEVEPAAAWVREHLLSINPDLLWECERLSDNQRLFVVTAEYDLGLRALADLIVQRAPVMRNWTFSSFRNPASPHMYESEFAAKSGGKLPDDLTVSLTRTPNNQIDLHFYSRTFKSANDENDISQSMILSSIVLGEEFFEKWIGYVFAYRRTGGAMNAIQSLLRLKSKDEGVPLASLQSEFERLKTAITTDLPSRPLAQEIVPENNPWTVIGMKVPEQPPADFEPPDRISYLTMTPSVVLSTLNARHFFSECHSSQSETFCYLKCARDPEVDIRQEREQLEKSIDHCLRLNNLGCQTGSGLGLNHLFIDLALSDVDKAVVLLRDTAREFDLPHDSWLLFYDSKWCAEWVGLYPDTRAPFEVAGHTEPAG